MQHMYIKCLIPGREGFLVTLLYLVYFGFHFYQMASESFQTISILSCFINIMLHHSFWCTLPNLNHIWLFTKLLTNQWQNNIIDLHYVSQGYFKMFILFLGFVSFPSSKDFLNYIDQRNSWEWLQKTFLIVA